MKTTLSIFLLALLFQISNCIYKFVFTLFRHGARGPVDMGSSTVDPLGEEWEETEKLTSFGISQQFQLGLSNRDRYQNFLKDLKPEDFYVISTNYNRTYMSAYYQLQGLFYQGTPPENFDVNTFEIPGNFKKFLKNDKPQYTSVNDVPIQYFKTDDFFHNMLYNTYCPITVKIIEQRKKLSTVQNFLKTFNSIYRDRLKKMFKIDDPGYYFDYSAVSPIADCFCVDKTENRPLKKLKEVGIDLNEFDEYAMGFLKIDQLIVKNGDSKLAKMGHSTTVKDIVNWMSKIIQFDIQGMDNAVSPRYVMFSMHDNNVGGMLNFIQEVLGDFTVPFPAYASNIIFELQISADVITPKVEDYFVVINFNHKQILQMPFTQFEKKIIENVYSEEEIKAFCKS